MKEKEVSGYYGSHNTPCTVFYYNNWYCIEGSVNINRTYDEVCDGVDTDSLTDYDMFTASKPVNSLDELINEVES